MVPTHYCWINTQTTSLHMAQKTTIMWVQSWICIIRMLFHTFCTFLLYIFFPRHMLALFTIILKRFNSYIVTTNPGTSVLLIHVFVFMKEYTLSEYLRMSGIYWGLTVMDLMGQLPRMNRQEIIDFITACQHECGGISASIGHDPHLLYTLSAIQVTTVWSYLFLPPIYCKTWSLLYSSIITVIPEIFINK